MKIRVAFFQKDLSQGGIQKSLVNLLNNLDNQKYQVDLYLWGKDNFFKIKNKNIRVIYQRSPSKFVRFFSRPCPFRLQKLFYKNRITKTYDIAIDYSSYFSLSSLAALKVQAKKRIIWVHNDVAANIKAEWRYFGWWIVSRAKFKMFDQVVAVSDWAKESFKSVMKILDSKVLVMSNYLDIEEIIRLSKKKFAGFQRSKINLVANGRLEYQKGFDILLRDFRTALNKNPKLRLYIISGGRELDNLRTLAKDLDIKEEVKFLGQQANPYKYLAAADAFVCTSRFEGQGLAILEAQVLGLPIILSKNLQDTIQQGQKKYDFINKIAAVRRTEHRLDKMPGYNKQVAANFAVATNYLPRVAFVSSGGGHLVELNQLAPLMEKYDSKVVTEGQDLLRDVNSNYLLKVVVNLRNLKRAKKIVREFRPDFVISTGAFTGALFERVAKKYGAKTIFIETAAQMYDGSRSGKFATKFTDLFIRQYDNKELRAVYPKSVFGGTVFNLKSQNSKKGKNILVLFGTQKNKFTRLARAVEKLDLTEKIIVQNGHTPVHGKNIKAIGFVPHAEYEQLNKDAKIVITHAGVGSIMQALALGKPVIVVPRLKQFGEHGDDHQLAIARDLAKRKMVLLVEDIAELPRALKQAEKLKSPKINLDNSQMLRIIEEFIDEH